MISSQSWLQRVELGLVVIVAVLLLCRKAKMMTHCLSLENEQMLESSRSVSVTSDPSGIAAAEELFGLEGVFELSTPTSADIEKTPGGVQIIPPGNSDEPSGDAQLDPTYDIITGSVPTSHAPVEDTVEGAGCDGKASSVILQMARVKTADGGLVSRRVLELDCLPVWCCVYFCGRRPEMEDAIAVEPRFLKIPLRLLVGDREVDGMDQHLSPSTGHFFGLYDGHGGAQLNRTVHITVHGRTGPTARSGPVFRTWAKTILILAIATLLFMAPMINAAIEEEEEEEETYVGEEEIPSLDSFSVSTDLPPPPSDTESSSRGLARFLLSKKKQKTLKCNKDPRICRAKGSPGPFCCKKKCVDVRTDRLNCGLCGKKCKYNETCCKGKCVNLATHKKHCGRCNNSCGAGNSCSFGLCNYA